LARFFQFWLGFFRFGSVFFWFFVGFGSVRFFRFFVYKTEPAGFFKNLIGFFLFGFFGYFFSSFLGLIGFPVFLLTPNFNESNKGKTKVVNSVPFRPEWPKHSIPIQKTEQNGTNFISF